METREADPDHSPTFEDITAQVIMIHIEATLDHNTGIDAARDNLTQPTRETATDLAMTHHTSHIADHPNIEVLQVIDPEITVGHIHNNPTDLQDMNLTAQIHIPAG